MRVVNHRRWNRRKLEAVALLTGFVGWQMLHHYTPDWWVVGPPLAAMIFIASTLRWEE